MNRFYGGEITAMLSACIENDQLSREDLQKLRSLLDESSDEKR